MTKDQYEGWGWVVKEHGVLIGIPDSIVKRVKGVHKELTLSKESKFFEDVLDLLKRYCGFELTSVTQIERIEGTYMRVKLDTCWSEWVYGTDPEDALDELSYRYDLFSDFF